MFAVAVVSAGRHLTFALEVRTAPRQFRARQIVGILAGDIHRGSFIVEQVLAAARRQALAAGQTHLAFIAAGLDGAESDVDLERTLIAPATFGGTTRIGFRHEAVVDVFGIDKRILAAAIGIATLRICCGRRRIALGGVYRRDVIVAVIIGRRWHIGLLAFAAGCQDGTQGIDPRGVLALAVGTASGE